MANFKYKDKKIIPEFVGALMKAVARRGSSKTIKKLQKDPIIRKNIDIITVSYTHLTLPTIRTV